MAMERVILETDVHCDGCARKIRKAVAKVLGVEKVQATPETGLVVVTGTADAEVLRSCIERRMSRDVVILVDSAAAHWAIPPRHDRRDGGWEMPPRRYEAPRHDRRDGGWEMPPRRYEAPRHDRRDGGWEMPPRRYEAPRQAYPHRAGSRYWAPAPRPRRHVSHGVPARHDDDEAPQECCSIQ